jgi:phosphoglucosamine mutase
VKRKPPLEDLPDYQKVLNSVIQKLGSEGRTFVRYSGTEPLVRVLVEGKDRRLIGKCAEELASTLVKELS